MKLGGYANRVAIGSDVDIFGQESQTWIRGSKWKRVRQKLLQAARPLNSRVDRRQLHRSGQILLNRELPLLRIAHPEIRIDRKRVRDNSGRSLEAVFQGQWIERTVLYS